MSMVGVRRPAILNGRRSPWRWPLDLIGDCLVQVVTALDFRVGLFLESEADSSARQKPPGSRAQPRHKKNRANIPPQSILVSPQIHTTAAAINVVSDVLRNSSLSMAALSTDAVRPSTASGSTSARSGYPEWVLLTKTARISADQNATTAACRTRDGQAVAVSF
jgi:hypothetical protein